MKHQVLFCLSLISFLSYSSEYSQVVAQAYLVHEMRWLAGQGYGFDSFEHESMEANYRVILDTPINKKDQNECLAIMRRAIQENRSAEELVNWSKSYDDSGRKRKVHRS